MKEEPKTQRYPASGLMGPRMTVTCLIGIGMFMGIAVMNVAHWVVSGSDYQCRSCFYFSLSTITFYWLGILVDSWRRS